jgi:hypothetical protein
MRWKFHNPVYKWDNKQLPPIHGIRTAVQNSVSGGLWSYVEPLSNKTDLVAPEESPMHEQIFYDDDLRMDHDHTDHSHAHLEALRNFIHNYRGLLHPPTENTDWEE